MRLVRFLGINILGLAALTAAWFQEWVQMIWEADISRLSVAIFGLLVVSQGFVYFKKLDLIYYTGRSMVLLGLIGTVLGFIVALGNISAEQLSNFDNLAPMVNTLISGMSVALYTTLVGSVSYLWLMTTTIFVGVDDER